MRKSFQEAFTICSWLFCYWHKMSGMNLPRLLEKRVLCAVRFKKSKNLDKVYEVKLNGTSLWKWVYWVSDRRLFYPESMPPCKTGLESHHFPFRLQATKPTLFAKAHLGVLRIAEKRISARLAASPTLRATLRFFRRIDLWREITRRRFSSDNKTKIRHLPYFLTWLPMNRDPYFSIYKLALKKKICKKVFSHFIFHITAKKRNRNLRIHW